MTATVASFNSGHTDMVHDIQFDYYGRRLASCSSDRTIKVFDVAGNQQRHVADLVGHAGPVWQVSWSHPKFGSLLASCSYDGKIIIWKEASEGVWSQVYAYTAHTASINSVTWAPYELGPLVLCGSSDGGISVLSYQLDGTWVSEKLDNAHPLGCTAVTWAPTAAAGSLVNAKAPEQLVKRFASCGCDNTIKVWLYNEKDKRWEQDGQQLVAHSDWVRDVAWAPNLGLQRSTLASCGQDGKVFIWSERPEGGWDKHELYSYGEPVWRLSWSQIGDILCVSTANNAVSLWKETIDGQWQQLAA